jgi:hypothetical protein
MIDLPPTATLVCVTSRLADSHHLTRFLAASSSFLTWLQAQPGFLRDELFRAPDGQFCDTMLWETPDHAAAANTLFEATPIRAEFAEIVSDYNGFFGTIEPLHPAEPAS